MSTERLPRIAVLGAGHVGPIIARMAGDAGYPVSISASGDPDRIRLIAEFLAPNAVPTRAADAVRAADLVVLAIPLHEFAALDPAMLAGKVVIDVMNYWPLVNGTLEMFEDRSVGSSEVVARKLSQSQVVKTFNHIGYHDMADARRAAGSTDRRALGVAGDDATAVAQVARVVDRIGFDPVIFDSLAAGRMFQPGGPVFGTALSRKDFESALAGAPTP